MHFTFYSLQCTVNLQCALRTLYKINCRMCSAQCTLCTVYIHSVQCALCREYSSRQCRGFPQSANLWDAFPGHCALYTLYSVLCLLWIPYIAHFVHCKLCTLYYVLCTLYTVYYVHCTLCTVNNLYSKLCTLYTVYYVHCTLCTVYTIYHVLSTLYTLNSIQCILNALKSA